MAAKESVVTDKAPPPLPFFSQAIKCNGMVYCSGSIGMDPVSMKLVEGGVEKRTVRIYHSFHPQIRKLPSHISRPNSNFTKFQNNASRDEAQVSKNASSIPTNKRKTGTSPHEPLRRPDRGRLIHRQRRQSQRLSDRHEGFRRYERGICEGFQQGSEAG